MLIDILIRNIHHGILFLSITGHIYIYYIRYMCFSNVELFWYEIRIRNGVSNERSN